MLNVLLWKPVACFDTTFNKLVSFVTLGSGAYCHAEVVFRLKKEEWKRMFKSFQIDTIKTRGDNIWSRMEDILNNVADDSIIPLAFYTIWGAELNVRLLTANDEYVFNRLPDPNFTDSISVDVNHEQLRHCIQFCLQELHKQYDGRKALMYWVPRNRLMCPRNRNLLPKKYFCSEFIVYMMQQIGRMSEVTPECVTPNDLNRLLKNTS